MKIISHDANIRFSWDGNECPLAYLITIRTFGTWLHGDSRGPVDRDGNNIKGKGPRTKDERQKAILLLINLNPIPHLDTDLSFRLRVVQMRDRFGYGQESMNVGVERIRE